MKVAALIEKLMACDLEAECGIFYHEQQGDDYSPDVEYEPVVYVALDGNVILTPSAYWDELIRQEEAEKAFRERETQMEKIRLENAIRERAQLDAYIQRMTSKT